MSEPAGYLPPTERLRLIRESEGRWLRAEAAIRETEPDYKLEIDLGEWRRRLWLKHSILCIPEAADYPGGTSRETVRRWVARSDWKQRRRVKRRISARHRRIVIQRAGGLCAYCAGEVPDQCMAIDHVIPVARGGRSRLGNLVAACWICNQEKGDCIWPIEVRPDPRTVRRRWREVVTVKGQAASPSRSR